MTPIEELENLASFGVYNDELAHEKLREVATELLEVRDKLARLTALLEPLRPLEAKATPGPWHQGPWHPDTISSPSRTVVDTSCSGMEGGGMESADDRAFVIAARNALAEMLRVVGS